MENRSKFNLNESVRNWKLELSHNSNMTQDNIEELESHLLDEIHDLEQLGLNTEESLLISKMRIGHVTDLSNEFGKVNRDVYFRNQIMPYLKGILMFMAFISVIEFITNFSIAIASIIGLNDGLFNNLSIGILILASSSLFILLYNKFRNNGFTFEKISSIPVLIILVILSKLLSFLSTPLTTRSIGYSNYGSIQLNLSVFELVVGIFILTISCLTYYKSKKDNRIEIAK